MKLFMKSQKGSSTLLIALTMIALVVFGALSLITASSGLKLAKRNAQAQVRFYTLDSEGARYVFNVKQLIKAGRDKAGEVIFAVKNSIASEEVADQDYDIIKASYQKARDKSAWEQRAFSTLSIYYLDELIRQNLEGTNIKNSLTETDLDEALTSEVPLILHLLKTFALEENGRNTYLDIKLDITEPAAGKSINAQCIVLEWRLWQEPFSYNQTIDLWEGKP
ncbi:MAG: hypothetical protein N2376_04470 [Clostridia bacterium]|nr:hypothetical protein [Clostridia bacterium]